LHAGHRLTVEETNGHQKSFETIRMSADLLKHVLTLTFRPLFSLGGGSLCEFSSLSCAE
jgi:hypothetical protein